MLDLIRTEEMFAAGGLHQALGLIDELVSKKPQWASMTKLNRPMKS